MSDERAAGNRGGELGGGKSGEQSRRAARLSQGRTRDTDLRKRIDQSRKDFNFHEIKN